MQIAPPNRPTDRPINRAPLARWVARALATSESHVNVNANVNGNAKVSAARRPLATHKDCARLRPTAAAGARLAAANAAMAPKVVRAGSSGRATECGGGGGAGSGPTRAGRPVPGRRRRRRRRRLIGRLICIARGLSVGGRSVGARLRSAASMGSARRAGVWGSCARRAHCSGAVCLLT